MNIMSIFAKETTTSPVDSKITCAKVIPTGNERTLSSTQDDPEYKYDPEY